MQDLTPNLDPELRTFLVVAVVNGIARRWLGGWTQARRVALLLVGWGVFYGRYFSLMQTMT